MSTEKKGSTAAELRERATLLRLRQEIKILRVEVREERERREVAEARVSELEARVRDEMAHRGGQSMQRSTAPMQGTQQTQRPVQSTSA